MTQGSRNRAEDLERRQSDELVVMRMKMEKLLKRQALFVEALERRMTNVRRPGSHVICPNPGPKSTSPEDNADTCPTGTAHGFDVSLTANSLVDSGTETDQAA